MIFNRERARQLIDFDGMNYGKILPTDIDGLIEYHGIAVIFYEFKYGNTDMPYGQRLAIERIVDAIAASGKHAVVFLCKHLVADPNEDVQAKDAIVTQTYYDGGWYDCHDTVKNKTTKFLDYIRRNHEHF